MSIHDLPDSVLLLALCIRAQELEDPAAWCREMRQLNLDIHSSPKTSDEAHTLMARSERLAQAIHKKRPPPMSEAEYEQLLESLNNAKAPEDFLNIFK